MDGEESETYPYDIVRRTNTHRTSMEPGFYLAIVRSIFCKTEDKYATVNDTLNAEYIEWTSSSEADKELIREDYCDRYAIFNAYHAMHYLISLISGMKCNVKFEKELVDTVIVDLEQSRFFENEYKKALAKLAEDTQEDTFEEEKEKDKIRDLLKAYLVLNKRQLDSLRDCSLQEFGIRKRTNDEFLAFLQLCPLWHRLRDVYEDNSQSKIHDLDRQLWLDLSSLLHVLENDSTFETIESRMTEWTYYDAILYGHKVIDIDQDISLDLANLPQSENFKVTLNNTFDPRCEYDCMSVYKEFRKERGHV